LGSGRLPGADWFRLLGLLHLHDLLDGVAYGIEINLTAAAGTLLADKGLMETPFASVITVTPLWHVHLPYRQRKTAALVRDKVSI
jgi:hypothetical protein